MTLSTIIVTWNAENQIGECLSSLLRNGPSDNQIIVVDNKSTDKTVEMVKAFPVFLTENSANLGLGVANEMGLEMAKGELVLVANPDITFTEDLANLLAYATSHPELDMIMPALEQNTRGAYHNAPHYTRFPFLLGTTLGALLDKHVRGFLTKYYTTLPRDETAYGSQERDPHSYGASCLLFRSKSAKKMGGVYRQKYFLYFADADLGKRLSRAGLKAARYPQASMKHYGGYSTKQLSHQTGSFLSGMGQGQFEWDWGHWHRGFAVWFLDTVYLLVRSRLRMTQTVRDRMLFLKGWMWIK